MIKYIFGMIGFTIVMTASSITISQDSKVVTVENDCNGSPKSCQRDVKYSPPGENKTGIKFHSPSCPENYTVIGGDYRITDVGLGNANSIFVSWAFKEPQPELNRFSVHVRNTDQDRTPVRVTMDVRATCLRISDAPLTRFDVALPSSDPYAIEGLHPIRVIYPTGEKQNIDRNDISVLEQYTTNLCAQNDLDAPERQIYFSPTIGLFSFTKDDRSILSKAGGDSGLADHPFVAEVKISHVRCQAR
ncbi:hypothetical protein [Stappia sp.]|uniref:hypothetical protein n=1 Tax=Stappia sp. TaxID=1870903 RepID=UPI003C7B023A